MIAVSLISKGDIDLTIIVLSIGLLLASTFRIIVIIIDAIIVLIIIIIIYFVL
jgi:hypothetical protein